MTSLRLNRRLCQAQRRSRVSCLQHPRSAATYVLIALFVINSTITTGFAASCTPGAFRPQLRDCPLQSISPEDGDQFTLQWAEAELKLPLLLDTATGKHVWLHEFGVADDLNAQSRISASGDIHMVTKAMKIKGGVAKVPAPVIYLSKGSNVKINLENTLAKPTDDDTYRVNMHTHGLHIGPDEDDSTVVVRPGETHLYNYNIAANHAGGTHWYHPHINTLGELHVGSGAAGMMIVKDAEDGTEIPKLVLDMPEQILVIQFIVPQLVMTVAAGAGGRDDRRKYINDDLYSMQVDGGVVVPDSAFYYLVNGFVQPRLALVKNKWTRLRIMHSSNGEDVELQIEGATCKVMLLATDGVYLPSGPRPDVEGDSSTPFRLMASSRMDIAVRCSAVSATAWITAKTPTTKVPIVQLGLEEPTVQAPADAFTTFAFQPCMPSYMPNLLVADVQDNAPFKLTVNPFSINGAGWAGFSQAMLMTIPLDTVQEWELTGGHHPFHMHINHFMLVKGLDHWRQAGDWVDTVEGLGARFRFKTATYPGRITMHCHNLGHADDGSMSQAWIQDDPSRPELKADVPWAQECNVPVDVTCGSQACPAAPSPTPMPTPMPTTSAPTSEPYNFQNHCFEKRCNLGCSGPEPANLPSFGAMSRSVTENECMYRCRVAKTCAHARFDPKGNNKGDCYFFPENGRLWKWYDMTRTCYIKHEGINNPKCNVDTTTCVPHTRSPSTSAPTGVTPTLAPTSAPTLPYDNTQVCLEKKCNRACSGPVRANIDGVGTEARSVTENQCAKMCLDSPKCAHFHYTPKGSNNGDCFFFPKSPLWQWYDLERTCYVKHEGSNNPKCNTEVTTCVRHTLQPTSSAPTPAPTPTYDPNEVCFEKKCNLGCSGPERANIDGVGTEARRVTEGECVNMCLNSPKCAHFQYNPKDSDKGDCFFFPHGGAFWRWGDNVRTCYVKHEGSNNPKCNADATTCVPKTG